MNRCRLFVKVVLLILVLISSVSWATTYYVSPDGNDTTGDGSQNYPFATIKYAVSQTTNETNDIINIGAGEYTESPISLKSNLEIIFEENVKVAAQNIDEENCDPGDRAKFDHYQACLLTLEGVSNIAIYGNGSTIQMRKNEYPVVVEFDPNSDVNPDGNSITIANHGLRTGDIVKYDFPSDSNSIAVNAGELTDGSNCYIIKIDSNTVKLATQREGIEGHIIDIKCVASSLHKLDPRAQRHGIRISNCDNIFIQDLIIKDTGGDGIKIGGNGEPNYSENISIKNVVCENAMRNGLAIEHANQVDIENCIIKDTSGHKPEAGIDIEPFADYMRLSDITIKNVSLINNAHYGISMNLSALQDGTGYENVNIEFDNVVIYACNDDNDDLGIYIQQLYEQQGEIRFKNIEIYNRGIYIQDKTGNIDLIFEDCILSHIDDVKYPINLYDSADYAPHVENITFSNCQIDNNGIDRVVIGAIAFGTAKEINDISGTIYIDNDVNKVYDWKEYIKNNIELTYHEGQTAEFTTYLHSVKNATRYEATSGQSGWFWSIQSAIDSASDGDVIEVNEGTYYEAVDFDGKAITLQSTDPNNWDVVEATIIDAEQANYGIRISNSADVKVKGFTVRNAASNGIQIESGANSEINRCIVKENYSGIYVLGSASISNNKIFDNTSSGIDITNAYEKEIKNNFIYGNGRGIYIQDCGLAPVIRNNTIVANVNGGAEVADEDDPIGISNCIVWGVNALDNCTATYSCVEGGSSGFGNIDSYPYFADYDANDFHLTFNSPCINRGDPNGNYTGEVDIDGESRIAAEEYVDARVDIGADEQNLHNINLVNNPGFEDGCDVSSTPLHWFRDQVDLCSIDCNEKHSGSYSWKFINNNETKWSGGYSESIPVEFGHTYKLTGWTKCETPVERTDLYWVELNDVNKETFFCWKDTTPGLVPWTPYGGLSAIRHEDTNRLKIAFYGPVKTTGTVWWDDFSLVEETEFLRPYGCENEPNVAKTVNFGGTETNTDWISGYGGTNQWDDVDDLMGGPETDANDGNINYRTTISGRTMVIEFPAFNIDSNDANGLPLTPMLLEIMYKDTTLTTDFTVKSKIGHINPDPNYGITDPNDRDKNIAHLGDCNDGRWKYIQYAFQKSDFQFLRAIDGKFTIKISSPYYTNGIPIDYVSLRKISPQEYEELTNKQRAMRGFYEADLPVDSPDEPDYDDPNLTVFVRDIMHPVYKHTRPDINEPNSIAAFSAWGEVEPASFSIYSQGGVNDLTITVSDLTHSIDSNSVINSSDIDLYRVIYDETRLGYTSIKSYALVPERLESFTTLSVDANTSERVWLKIQVPDHNAGLPAGLYQGRINIERIGEPNVYVPIDVDVYDITLDKPNSINPVWADEWSDLSSDSDTVYKAVSETGFEPFSSYTTDIAISLIAIDEENSTPENVVFDTADFNDSLNRSRAKGFLKNNVMIYIGNQYYLRDLYKLVTGQNYSESDPDLWNNLDDSNFKTAFGKLIDKYTEIGNSYEPNITFIYFLYDEPGVQPNRRIICDRLGEIIHNHNGLTAVDYYTTCDLPLPTVIGNTTYGLDKYNVPDGSLPPMTNLVDYKIWAPSCMDDGYARHNDSSDPNYYDGYSHFGYYTTSYSHLANPVYSRFLYGLFAFRTNAAIVFGYKFGCGTNDPYNDFDTRYDYISLSTLPDFLYAYPTWSGELLPTIGGLEAIREGIKDARYIATLKRLISENPGAIANDAQSYLDDVCSRIDPNYSAAYSKKATELGYYEAILKSVSDTNTPDDFEVFTRVRKDIASYIILLTQTTDVDHDGMSDEWESAVCLNPNDANDRNDDRDNDGHTNLEEYLNWLLSGEPLPVNTDLNCDDIVNAEDFSAFADHWQSSLGDAFYSEKYDFDRDDEITLSDLSYIAQDWLTAGQEY